MRRDLAGLRIVVVTMLLGEVFARDGEGRVAEARRRGLRAVRVRGAAAHIASTAYRSLPWAGCSLPLSYSLATMSKAAGKFAAATSPRHSLCDAAQQQAFSCDCSVQRFGLYVACGLQGEQARELKNRASGL